MIQRGRERTEEKKEKNLDRRDPEGGGGERKLSANKLKFIERHERDRKGEGKVVGTINQVLSIRKAFFPFPIEANLRVLVKGSELERFEEKEKARGGTRRKKKKK